MYCIESFWAQTKVCYGSTAMFWDGPFNVLAWKIKLVFSCILVFARLGWGVIHSSIWRAVITT